jgi:hypothetical protein
VHTSETNMTNPCCCNRGAAATRKLKTEPPAGPSRDYPDYRRIGDPDFQRGGIRQTRRCATTRGNQRTRRVTSRRAGETIETTRANRAGPMSGLAQPPESNPNQFGGRKTDLA